MFSIKNQNLRLILYKLILNCPQLRQKWPTYLIPYFSTMYATNEIDDTINASSHDVNLNNPIDTEFNFERINNMAVHK